MRRQSTCHWTGKTQADNSELSNSHCCASSGSLSFIAVCCLLSGDDLFANLIVLGSQCQQLLPPLVVDLREVCKYLLVDLGADMQILTTLDWE